MRTLALLLLLLPLPALAADDSTTAAAGGGAALAIAAAAGAASSHKKRKRTEAEKIVDRDLPGLSPVRREYEIKHLHRHFMKPKTIARRVVRKVRR